MKIYEIKYNIKSVNVTKTILITDICVGKNKIEMQDYSTGMILSYNANDIKIEYVKEAN
jgi:hypothetical protein